MPNVAGKSKKNSKKRAQHRPRTSGNPAKQPVLELPPVTVKDWIGAARLRTLPLAAAPVIIGTGAAQTIDHNLHWVIALFCLAVALLLQIGVNFANDYSDGIRGTDSERVGPARLTASGRVPAKRVLTVALVFFALAALAGLAIVIRTQQWWMLAVGAACIVAAWFYTGGKRPYGYNALGEVFVFVFFGLVATLGTTWVQAFALPLPAWLGAIAAGLFACAVLLANNLRDIVQDGRVGKRTLTVLIGKRATQVLFTLFVLVPFGIAAMIALIYPIAWLSLLALLAGVPAIVIVWWYRQPRELVIALGLTSLTALAYAGFLYWAFVG
ncbi:1,4-dihydroxy-2-naphthoate polyprenyltransferase [Microbacterium esteraromaticum]|uniref:1,4-dihydroxy-2-naphthoate octaprenyltransferase n=1 Tax=Microbacterium esteraromaticum TaxID=57043 RepID=A0A939DX92_9MICO|nr:1,4-dihydroxy-2-naphthoate polyprenyltransferase [Microbacterium esteraromaticum]MBN7794506.1 1,4-dihydroxy-2-naphthoate polyprenyltransferase [Microbacterium esteraromaticum]MBN8206595.1 1,4-dihydroxy-2-naphthoate polyprenyltransferase [Microbacterium esteraromaticum]MBN8416750.1 1,4-dihydroxy-2-naphthoate polyprenyltransferase [Microbacterium esteraromaticum]MBN8425377.1 1,4-dihydroxy-2-naphthoate polyprenyltransferase [Microbacterium esteraromaticum]